MKSLIKPILKIGFAVISSEPSAARLKATVNSIKNNLICSEIICVVPKNTKKEDVKELEKICAIYKGKETFVSLLNAAFKNGCKEWTTTIIEGAYARKNLDKRYSFFAENEKDILFAVDWEKDVQGKPTKIYNNFWDCSLNGIMMHSNAFKEIGEFEESSNLEISRLLWAANAADKGYKFKGIMGAKMI